MALTPVVFFPDSPLDWIDRLGLPWTMALAPFYAGFVTAQVFRYRRVSGPVERQQTKWVVFGAAALGGLVGLTALSAGLSLPSDENSMTYSHFAGWAGAYILLSLIPLSIGFAVLRTRLFDVDVLINRALVYTLLTASLVVVYLGAVVPLQYASRGFVGETSQLAVVVSTLAIAALFSPLRHRIQTLIDRRFYREKYDARETLEAFSATLRDETDLDSLGSDLTAVVRETMRPEDVSLWLRGPEDGARR